MHLSYWVFAVFSLTYFYLKKVYGVFTKLSHSILFCEPTVTDWNRYSNGCNFFRSDWIQISKERRDSIKPRQDKPIQVIYMLDVILFMQIREAQWVLNEPVNIPSLNVKAFHWKYRNVLLLAVNVCHRFIWVWIEWY